MANEPKNDKRKISEKAKNTKANAPEKAPKVAKAKSGDESQAPTADGKAKAKGTSSVKRAPLAPKTFFAKLFTPFIRRALPRQTVAAMEALRALL